MSTKQDHLAEDPNASGMKQLHGLGTLFESALPGRHPSEVIDDDLLEDDRIDHLIADASGSVRMGTCQSVNRALLRLPEGLLNSETGAPWNGVASFRPPSGVARQIVGDLKKETKSKQRG
jgi:hypothetical protein